MEYQFERVEGSDQQIEILYQLLSKRAYSISHTSMPAYNDHKNFVKNHPYLDWFIVKSDQDYLGSFYIKHDNSIGLNLTVINIEIVSASIDFIKNCFRPLESQASMVSKYFYVNVSASNEELIAVMRSLDTSQIQISFKL